MVNSSSRVNFSIIEEYWAPIHQWLFASLYFWARIIFLGQCQLLEEPQTISIPLQSLVIIMSPNQKYVVTLISICVIATLALVTGMIELFQHILHLTEETRSVLQSVALTGQVLLLVTQAMEKIHSGLRVIQVFQAAPQPILSHDVSSAGGELEICIQTTPGRHSPDYTIITQRHLSTQESFVSAECEDN